MSKKRLDASKIAKQPKLKKDMAKFVAKCVVTLTPMEDRPSLEDLLYKGHRGFISINDGDLLRHFEKWHAQVERDLNNLNEGLAKKDGPIFRWNVESQIKVLKELYEISSVIMSDTIDEVLLR